LSTELFLHSGMEGEKAAVVASGAWTAPHARELELKLELLVNATGQRPASRPEVAVDAAGIRELDTFGAWLLERLLRELQTRFADVRLVGLHPHHHGLFAEVQQANRGATARRDTENSILLGLETVGRRMSSLASDFAALVAMLGAIGEVLARVLVRPRTLRLTSTVHQLDRVGWQAVPIILLITFLIGCIIAQQGIFHFRKFGADDYVVDLVGILVLREIGVLLVAIMVAGRSGSSYTAELGSMKMREEIDALRTMGRDPVEVLILPRVLALVLGLPMLTFLGSLSALYGGGLVAWLYGGMSPAIFIARLQEAVSITHFEVGLIKAPFMALVIGAVACSEGLKVKGSAESLGLQTTTSVVKSIFLVIVLDGLFAVFFASIGM
jgi:phospholipid/cholesterol/gamma-HCH transport system permease protein